MRITAVILLTLAAACLQACASSRRDGGAPNAVVFRRGEAIEFYDFRLRVSHAGGDQQVVVRDCSTDDFHCFAGVSLLIAPRKCSDLRRLVRRTADWRVNEAERARFLFASENQLYYGSGGAAGFVYDIERGVVGVWRSPAAAQSSLDTTAMRAIVDSTKWLESPATLFACREQRSVSHHDGSRRRV
jgi:hypothetical protein